jgi:hypothetical protein
MKRMRNNQQNLWRPTDIARLKELLHARAAIPEIARELGRTEGAVRTRAQQLGISLRALRRATSTLSV